MFVVAVVPILLAFSQVLGVDERPLPAVWYPPIAKRLPNVLFVAHTDPEGGAGIVIVTYCHTPLTFIVIGALYVYVAPPFLHVTHITLPAAALVFSQKLKVTVDPNVWPQVRSAMLNPSID